MWLNVLSVGVRFALGFFKISARSALEIRFCKKNLRDYGGMPDFAFLVASTRDSRCKPRAAAGGPVLFTLKRKPT